MERQLLGMNVMLFFSFQWSEVSVLFGTVLNSRIHFKCLFCTNLTVIDMMVDPDGTLDALSNLGLTNPLTDQKVSPGTQQGVSVLNPGAGASSSTLSSSRPEGLASDPCGPSDHAEVAERDPGPQQSSRSYNWSTKNIIQNASFLLAYPEALGGRGSVKLEVFGFRLKEGRGRRMMPIPWESLTALTVNQTEPTLPNSSSWDVRYKIWKHFSINRWAYEEAMT